MSRHWCATLFSKPKWLENKELPDKIRYAIIGEEICPTTKNTHWQCYFEFSKPIRMKGAKLLLDDEKAHLEIRKGTREQARDYCKKDNKFSELGEWISGQGHRSDLKKIVQKLKEGTKLSQIMEDDPNTYCQYRNGLKEISANIQKQKCKEFRTVEVILHCGPTGCGKTRKAVESGGTDYYKIEGENLQWFQDYEQESCLIIDEYNNDVSITKMLNLLDGYQLRLNVKGSHTYANWNKVFITTNLKPEQLHSNAKPEHRNALFRRINTIINDYPSIDIDTENCSEVVQGNTDLDQ